MPLQYSAAHSSRITKTSRGIPPLKRSSSSPFGNLRRTKTFQRSQSKPECLDETEDFLDERLEDIGLVRALATNLSLRDVAQVIQYAHTHMFDTLPERGGFNSTHISEILNFRKSLPPTVTVAHVHALTRSPTQTEREIAELTRAGTVRRLMIPGRGTGGSSVADGLILAKDVTKLVTDSEHVGDALAGKFLSILEKVPTAATISCAGLTATEISCLMRSGFATFPVKAADTGRLASSSASGGVTSIPTVSRAASGSIEAVGGDDAIFGAGGHGGIRRSAIDVGPCNLEGLREFCPSLPGMGPYLKLLTAGRSHLISLINKSRFREIPLCLLKERWEGGISGENPAAKAKQYRREFSGVLACRTRKWKQFYGLSFEWVLAECLGSGLIEVFETGTVGQAVRVP